MARNLVERLAAAMSPRARIADNETLLADLKAEQARLEVARDQAAAESVDFTLSEDDREEAAAKAGRLDRTIKGLEGEIAKIAALIEERRSDDARKAAESEKRAALTERNEIAARFAERVPAITAELIGLFKAVEANEARMRAAGMHEANAEWKARGIPGNGLVGGLSSAMPFIKLKIPEFNGAGRAWPIDQANAISAKVVFDYGEAIRRGREERARQEKEKAEAAAKFAREHGRYEITVYQMGEPVRIPEELVSGNIPAAMGCWDRKQLLLSHEVAKKLAAVPGLRVKLMGGGKK